MSATSSVLDRVNTLRQQLAGLVTLDDDQQSTISWQCPELDQFMPGGGLQSGMIIEVLYDRLGSGATSLAMHCAKQAVEQLHGPLVVVDRGQKFYPPAAVARGIEVRDLIVVGGQASSESASQILQSSKNQHRPNQRRPMSSAEEIWALDQALRCKGVAVVMAWLDKIDPHAYRRLQLAAEVGQTLAILIRPERVRTQPTWADVQLLVSPAPPAINRTRTRQAPDSSRLYSNTYGESRHSRSTTPHTPYDSSTRFLRATLLRQRGRGGSNSVEGQSIELMMNEKALKISAGTGNSNWNRNESRTMHMAPRVANPAARRRSAGA